MDVEYEPVTQDPNRPYVDHIGATRQYMRDFILGVNDGLVSMFLLVAGVVGGGLTSRQVLLTGIAGAIAGAISMAAGEYMATKSQEEVFDAEMELERDHLIHHRDHERNELREMFTAMGVDGSDVETIVAIIDKKDESMMKVMASLEFGIVDTERRNPYWAAVASGLLFLLGSLPSVVPFAFDPDPNSGLLIAAVLASGGLFAVGMVKTMMTRKNPWIQGAENLTVALAGAVASYWIGVAFDTFVGT